MGSPLKDLSGLSLLGAVLYGIPSTVLLTSLPESFQEAQEAAFSGYYLSYFSWNSASVFSAGLVTALYLIAWRALRKENQAGLRSALIASVIGPATHCVLIIPWIMYLRITNPLPLGTAPGGGPTFIYLFGTFATTAVFIAFVVFVPAVVLKKCRAPDMRDGEKLKDHA